MKREGGGQEGAESPRLSLLILAHIRPRAALRAWWGREGETKEKEKDNKVTPSTPALLSLSIS